MGNDDELLEAIGMPDGRLASTGMPMAPLIEWTPEVEALWAIERRVGQNTAATQNAYAKKPQRAPKGHPGPETAYIRLRRRNRWEQHRSLVARVLPHKAN